MELHAAIDNQGRVLIPAEVRRQLHLERGGEVSLDICDDTLVLRNASNLAACMTCGQPVGSQPA